MYLCIVLHYILQKLARIALGHIPEHWSLWQQYSTGVILSETGEKSSEVENLKQEAAKHSKEMKVSGFCPNFFTFLINCRD